MRGNWFLRLLWLLGAMAGLGGNAIAATPCVSWPEIAATDYLDSKGLLGPAVKDGSYRVREVMWDQVLGKRWALIASCEHPEQPAFAVPAGAMVGAEPALGSKDDSSVVVRAGDTVRLWRQEEDLRIEMAAISEENGGLGKTIRVRLIGAWSAERQFVGVVRGVANVEMSR